MAKLFPKHSTSILNKNYNFRHSDSEVSQQQGE